MPAPGKLWVLTADEAFARVLALPGHGQDLEEIELLTDAGSRADDADLRRDAYGRRAGGDLRSGGNITASAGETALHQEAALFANRVAQWLAEAHQKGRFTALRIAAAPRFLGLLRKALTTAVAQVVIDDCPLDLVKLNRRELTLKLFPAGEPVAHRPA
ncbi:host attachment protein [Pseudaquabacterium terrae]|uniref:host attachment protein n=1 Tax=Pseudaquabacterium terrae TaxID=2732868 RepID=UPI0031B619DB